MPPKKKKKSEERKDYHLYPAVQVRLVPEIKELLSQMTGIKGNQTSVISLALEYLHSNVQKDASILENVEKYERSTTPQYTRGIRQKKHLEIETTLCN